MRVRMLRTMEPRAGEGTVTFAKGALVNVSEEMAEEWLTQTPPVAELALDEPRGKAFVAAKIRMEGDQIVVVDATVTLADGDANEGDPPVLRLLKLDGGGRLLEGAPLGEHVPAPATWRFEKTEHAGTAVFESQCTGFEPLRGDVAIAAAKKVHPVAEA